jgi:alcohol dehydrogenase (NADP+)
MIAAIGWAAQDAKTPLAPMRFERNEPGQGEVRIEVKFCGVCHSDLHQVRNEWGNTVWPCLPGHEIVGEVSAVGPGVTRYKLGDRVGVGCLVNSCRTCEPCREHLEQYCEGPVGPLATYNGPMNPPGKKNPGATNIYGVDNTFGGYSNVVVVHEDFVLRIPDSLDPAHAAPILCAGVTTFSPMRHWGVKAGDKVGIVGLGGLGHMAVKLAKALGAEVTVFTTRADKVDAAHKLGADQVIREDDAQAMSEPLLSFDFILSTVPQKHDINAYIKLLKRDRTLVLVGALEPMAPVDNSQVAFHRRSVAGSLIGGIAETQEVLDFCAEHGIAPDIQTIRAENINEAFEKMQAGEVRFRYVIDMSTLEAA